MKSPVNILLICAIFFSACKAETGDNLKTEDNTRRPQPEGVVTIEHYLEGKKLANYPSAVFAGGCFWCTEASFQRIEGVVEVISGYAGGKKERPTYGEVSSGKTSYAESIYVIYDSTVIDYQTLLSVFFTAHDPTQVNRQGPDIGPQYRSAIFYRSGRQQKLAENKIEELNRSGNYNEPVATELNAYDRFWVAEAYHQDYYDNHPDDPYIKNVSRPKVKKVEIKFNDILKQIYRK